MADEIEFIDPPEDHPDRLENCGLSEYSLKCLRRTCLPLLSDFDGKTDVDILREPGINRRVLRELREAQARRAQTDKD